MQQGIIYIVMLAIRLVQMDMCLTQFFFFLVCLPQQLRLPLLQASLLLVAVAKLLQVVAQPVVVAHNQIQLLQIQQKLPRIKICFISQSLLLRQY